MISLTSNMMATARGRGRWSLTAAQESRIVAALIVVFLAGAMGVVLHAIAVATAW